VLDSDPFNKAVLSSLTKIVFFGAPHHGMDTQDIEAFLDNNYRGEPVGDARKALVEELRGNNDAAERELQEFTDLIGGELKIQIVSIYERKPSHRLINVDKNADQNPDGLRLNSTGSWKREGSPYIPVRKDSTLLGLPKWLEVPIASESDHSNMAKFDHKDLTYRLLVHELKKAPQQFVSRAFPWISDGQDRAPNSLPNWQVGLLQVLSELRTPERFRLDLRSQCEQTYTALVETQTWIALAEHSTCNALMEKNRALALRVGFVLSSQFEPIYDALQLVGEFLPNSPIYQELSSEEMHIRLRNLATQANELSSTIQSALAMEESETGSTSSISGPWQQTDILRRLVSMKLSSASSSRVSLDGQVQEEPTWISLESLLFPNEPEGDTNRDQAGWLQRLVQYFSGSKPSSLKLKARRFGALKTEDSLETVMIEFRPYPKDSLAEVYSKRRRAFSSVGKMILCSRIGDAKFPTVPLRYLSEIESSSTPCFLFVYAAENLFGLDEALEKFETPSVKERLWLALCYAKAIDSIHSADICHGLINPYNLYLKAPKSFIAQKAGGAARLDVEKSSPCLAGFEISRSTVEYMQSDKVDVDDPHWRVFLHPARLSEGSDKSLQSPAHDLFSLGMVMTVIGHWRTFTSFQKYQQANTETERRDFAMKLRKHFRGGSGNHSNMPAEYADIISFCLGRSKGLSGEDIDPDEEIFLRSSGHAKTSRVVAALTRLYGLTS